MQAARKPPALGTTHAPTGQLAPSRTAPTRPAQGTRPAPGTRPASAATARPAPTLSAGQVGMAALSGVRANYTGASGAPPRGRPASAPVHRPAVAPVPRSHPPHIRT
eukprot:CAMPEP_0118820178 /NCGR_PEP_ID=MMETSP1162-20130426/7526_1 /TAXON_ID=33656 /ORGANISM="Phaeocystis Sp, Strain CCMP2710" /LENGTH=106 /DNA_ID=CAMNT_0006750541 /DNA_START=179 /DNA_END=495 /DNA_ORIENTATION=-